MQATAACNQAGTASLTCDCDCTYFGRVSFATPCVCMLRYVVQRSMFINDCTYAAQLTQYMGAHVLNCSLHLPHWQRRFAAPLLAARLSKPPILQMGWDGRAHSSLNGNATTDAWLHRVMIACDRGCRCCLPVTPLTGSTRHWQLGACTHNEVSTWRSRAPRCEQDEWRRGDGVVS